MQTTPNWKMTASFLQVFELVGPTSSLGRRSLCRMRKMYVPLLLLNTHSNIHVCWTYQHISCTVLDISCGYQHISCTCLVYFLRISAYFLYMSCIFPVSISIFLADISIFLVHLLYISYSYQYTSCAHLVYFVYHVVYINLIHPPQCSLTEEVLNATLKRMPVHF